MSLNTRVLWIPSLLYWYIGATQCRWRLACLRVYIYESESTGRRPTSKVIQVVPSLRYLERLDACEDNTLPIGYGQGSGVGGGERSEDPYQQPHSQEWVSNNTGDEEGCLAQMMCQELLCQASSGAFTSSSRSQSANVWAKGTRTNCLDPCSPWASAALAVSPLASTT